MSGASKRIWITALSIIITAGILTAVLRWHDYNHVREDASERLAFQIKLAEKEVSGLVRSINIVLEEIVQALEADNAEAADKLGVHYKKLFPEIRSFTLVDAAGIIRQASIKALIGGDRSESAYYKEIKANPDRNILFLGRPFKDPLDASIMLFNRAIPDKNGKLKWIAIASVNLKFYDHLLKSVVDQETQQVFLIHGDGLILSHNADYEGLRLQSLSHAAGVAAEHLESDKRQQHYQDILNTDNTKMYAVTADVIPENFHASNRLVVGITEDSSVIYEQWKTDTLIYSLVWLLASILIIYLVYLHWLREMFLLQSESRFKDFTDTASDWIWEMDKELHFTNISEQFFKITNFKPDDLIGKTRWEYTSAEKAGIPEQDWQAHRMLMERHQAFRDFRYQVTDKGGNRYHISLNGNPVFVKGVFTGYRGTGTDITPLVNALNNAQQAQKKAEAASQAKSQFLSSMSHELRTPMNAILGYAQILNIKLKDTEHEESIEVMMDSGRHLMELINDVLDLSRIEADKMQYNLSAIDVSELLAECYELCLPLANSRGITISIESGPGLQSYFVYADRVRMKQALLNYLSNAIKYGKQQDGFILVIVSAKDKMVRIAVVDNGGGIESEKAEQVFSPFDRLGLECGTVLGAGLGLSITKKIIEDMGGAVGVVSETGEGATFWMQLPACKPGVESVGKL